MRHGRIALGLGLAILAGVAAGPLVAQEREITEEPPLEFLLEVGEKTILVGLDTPFEVQVGEQKVTMRLRARPDRLFTHGGLRFRYPSGHGFEVDAEDPSVTIWTLDGNDNVLMLMKYSADVTPDQVLESMRASMMQQYGERNVTLGVSRLKVGGRDLVGSRLDVSLAGNKLIQDLYSFSAGGAAYAFIVQDSPTDDGNLSAETQAVIKLLERTFEFPAE